MHEMSLMSGVFEVIDSTLINHPHIERVVSVRLKVGQFTNTVPSALEFAFEAFAQGTKVEGAKLEIETVPMVGRCSRCGNEFKVHGIAFCCPQCASYTIEIISGRELFLESLEVE